MDLRQIEVFLTVARHLHFGRAAEELYLSQPAVSQTIHRLERELGGELFDRTTRRVRLTELGTSFRREVEPAHDALVAAFEHARRFAARDALRLVVGYSADGGADVVSLIPAVQRRFPEVVLELRSLRTTAQMRALVAGELDAGLCWCPQLDERFESAEVGSSRLAALVRDDHPFAQRTSVDLAELANEPLIVWGRAVNPVLYDRFAAAMDATGEPWALVGTAAGAVEVAARVVSGFGLGVVLESMAHTRIEGVRPVPVRDGPVICRTLVWRRDDRSELLGAFVAVMRRRARQAERGSRNGERGSRNGDR